MNLSLAIILAARAAPAPLPSKQGESTRKGSEVRSFLKSHSELKSGGGSGLGEKIRVGGKT